MIHFVYLYMHVHDSSDLANLDSVLSSRKTDAPKGNHDGVTSLRQVKWYCFVISGKDPSGFRQSSDVWSNVIYGTGCIQYFMEKACRPHL